MDEKKITEFKEDFALFIESGFIAVKLLDEVSARRIFQAAQALNPDHTAPQIGMGYIALNKLEIKQATHIFEQLIQKEPDNYLAQAFLAICFLLTKDKQKKGQSKLLELKEQQIDTTIQNLCTVSLEWYEKDLSKKMHSIPFFNQPSKADKTENI